MKRKPTRTALIRAIVLKDLREVSRDRLWMILMPVSLAAFILIFWVLPRVVNESVAVGVTPPEFARALSLLAESGENFGIEGRETVSGTAAAGLRVVSFDDESDLAAAVSGGRGENQKKKVAVGIAFPEDFLSLVGAGEATVVSVYLDAAVPAVLGGAVASGIREMAAFLRAAALGRNPLTALPVAIPDLQTIVLGEDRSGAQVPLREKLRPLMAILILIIEAVVLAGLVAVEIEHRTVTAMLITPARTGDVLAAKGITGAVLALSQGLFFLAVTRSFNSRWPIVLILMLLGALMTSAVGMMAGAAGREFMSTLFFALVFISPLLIPAFSIIFPGAAPLWIRALPSYGLIQSMVDSIAYGRGWSEAAPHIATSLAWTAALFGAGLIILKRRVEAL